MGPKSEGSSFWAGGRLAGGCGFLIFRRLRLGFGKPAGMGRRVFNRSSGIRTVSPIWMLLGSIFGLAAASRGQFSPEPVYQRAMEKKVSRRYRTLWAKGVALGANCASWLFCRIRLFNTSWEATDGGVDSSRPAICIRPQPAIQPKAPIIIRRIAVLDWHISDPAPPYLRSPNV